MAQKYGMECLLHEKPFAGINGSGKHLNWSLGNSTQGNLLEPGDTPHDNMQFLVFCGGGDSGRAQVRRTCCGRSWPRPTTTIAWARTKPRRRSSRSSWAISSPTCSSRSRRAARRPARPSGTLTVGVDTLPPLPKDAGDRNRTSPFAFTGNKFEFRAVGASQSIAGPLVALNTIVAESLDYIATELEKATGGDAGKLNAAVQKLLQEIMHQARRDHLQRRQLHRGVARGGREARPAEPEDLRRCLAGARQAERWSQLFEKYGVLSPRELQSRHDIYVEQYCKTVSTEAKLTIEIARR